MKGKKEKVLQIALECFSQFVAVKFTNENFHFTIDLNK